MEIPPRLASSLLHWWSSRAGNHVPHGSITLESLLLGCNTIQAASVAIVPQIVLALGELRI